MSDVQIDLLKVLLENTNVIRVELSFGIAGVGNNLASSFVVADKTMYFDKKNKNR